METILQQAHAIFRDVFRYRWIVFLVAWGVCLVAWPIVLMLPNKYEARARVFVDPSTALKPVIQGLAIEQDLNAELNLVRQSLLSTPNLEKIVDETGLTPAVNVPANRAKAVFDLSQRIDIVAVPTPPGPGEAPVPSKVYVISYQDANRDRSLKVVQILLDSFMEGTLGGKRRDSQTAQRFVEGQIKDYEAKLGEAEQSLAEFKKKNAGMVPGDQTGDYFTRLQAEVDAVKKTQTSLNIAITKRAELAQQLRGEGPAAASSLATAGPGGGAGTRGGDTLSRIQETQARLDDLLLRFTDKHPDVIALRQTLQELKDRRASELEALKRGDAGAAVATGASANPVYQSIQLQLNQADVDVAAFRGELADHQAKVADLKRLVDTTPQVEAEFARLNRDYTVNKAQYAALVERLEKARLGGEADATGSVRFDIIDPPTADFNPVSPKRSMLLATVLLAALGGGGGLAYLITMSKPVFHNSKQLAALTGIPVLGVVSATRVAGKRPSMRREYLTYSLACSTFVVALVVVVFVGRTFAPLTFSVGLHH
jgi:polysaccharide chain length determinant protein (PEP-CTERM system associated)